MLQNSDAREIAPEKEKNLHIKVDCHVIFRNLTYIH